MGILNVTPDSFSDGGQFQLVENAIARALQMEADGADIIDIGGESTRPGAEPVMLDEELRRTIPVIRELATRVRIPISIDTTKAEVLKSVSHLQRDLQRPVLIGHSRKRFLSKILGRSVDERELGTIGVSIALAEQGVDILRIHDVRSVRDAIVAWDMVRSSHSVLGHN
jgi:dihydropteroate synthase